MCSTKALTLGAKVTGLEGQLPDNRLLVSSHYHEASTKSLWSRYTPNYLCHVLTQKLNEYSSQITWYMSHSVERFEEHNDEVRIFGSHQNQKFDAL